MDAKLCRDHLEKLVSEELTALAQLEGLLEREHTLLLDNDIEEFERAGELRQACVTTLMRIEDERRNLCQMSNVPTDMHGLQRLLTWCDPDRSLQTRWADCAELAIRCRNSNERNGALVSARLKRVEGLLETLTGRANQPKIYARQGGYQATGRSAHVLARV
jgi:flagellar biosynthesis/type III secretory pathway chaperone